MLRILRVWTVAVLAAIVAGDAVGTQQQTKGDPPPVIIGGSGGGGGGTSSGGPAGGAGVGGGAGGTGGGGGGLYDGYGDIDWDGPDEVPFSPLIFQAFDVPAMIQLVERTTEDIASSVPAQPMSYVQALAAVQAIFTADDAASVRAYLKKAASTAAGAESVGRIGAAAAVAGHLDYALATMLAKHEADPQDATALFNMASLLVQRKMANEALAMLDKLNASGRLPDLPFNFNPRAGVDYLRGYALLMIGQLQQSQSLLRRAFAADRTMTDASYALAVGAAAIGGDVRKPLLEGIARAYAGPMIYCGKHYADDPLTTEEDENVGPPADRIFDLSSGRDGVLPPLQHPGSGATLARMLEDLPKEEERLRAEAQAHDKRATALSEQLRARLETSAPDATDLVDQALVDLINEANVCLKPLQQMLEQRNRLSEELGDRLQPSMDALGPLYLKLGELETTDTLEAHRELARQMVSTGIGLRRGAISEAEAAVRLHFRSWHKYATGMAGYITDPTWREYATEIIRGKQATEWVALYVGTIANYGALLPASTSLYEPVPPATLIRPQDPTVWRCDPAVQKGAVEAKVIKVDPSDWPPGAPSGLPSLGVTVKAGCDKVAVEADAQFKVNLGRLGEAGVGGFVEAAVAREGDITIFGGPKVSGTMMGAGGSFKDGVYLTFDQYGMKEVGSRVSGSQVAGGSLRGTVKPFDEKFVIWAAPPRPPRFDKSTGLTIWRNLNDNRPGTVPRRRPGPPARATP